MRAIDGTRLKEYLACRRVPYLDFHLPPERALPPTPRMQVLFEAGRRIERRILQEIAPVEVAFERGDFDAGHAATVAAMATRAPAIANGVLKDGDLLGRPDLLLWNDAAGGYEVADVKSTQTVHAPAMLQVALYSRLVACVGPEPTHGIVIVRDGARVRFPLDEVAASLDHALERLRALRGGKDPGAHWTEACTDCRYRVECLAELETTGDPSLVPGLTRAQKEALARAGVRTLADLAATESPAAVGRAAGLPADLIRRLSVRARAVADGRPLPVIAPRDEVRAAPVALAALVHDRVAEPVIAVAGIVFASPETFRVRFLRRRETADPAVAFFTLVRNLAGSRGPILVFGANVRRALEEGLALVPRAARWIDDILGRLVDLRAELRRAVALPGFDRTPALALRSAGLAPPAGASEEDDAIAALRYLEEEDGTSVAAVERLLRAELEAIAALRKFLGKDAAR